MEERIELGVDNGKPSFIGALMHHNFQLFWGGQLISLLGSWMQTVAQVWLVLQITSSPFLLGLTSAVQFLPLLLFSLMAGVVIDRYPKRSILIITQISLMIFAVVLGVLTLGEAVRFWHVLVFAALMGIASTFDMPTRQSFVVELVGRRDLMNAIALNSFIFNVGRIFGPALAGILIGKVGIGICFIINAVTFIPVIIGLFLIKLPSVKAERQGGDRMLARIKEGLVYIRKTPVILNTMVLMALINIFAMNLTVLVPILAKDNLRLQAFGFGLLMAASGIGALAGASILAVISRKGLKRKMLLAGAGALCMFEILLAFSSSFIMAFVFLVFIGWSMMTFRALVNTTIQLNVPDNLRGRVMSVDALVFGGITPVGSLLSGTMAHFWGAPVGLAAGALFGILSLGIVVMIERQGVSVQLNTEEG